MKRGRSTKGGGAASSSASAAAAASQSPPAAAAAAAAASVAAPTPPLAPNESMDEEGDEEEEEDEEPLPPRDPTLNVYHDPLIGPEYQVEVGPFVQPASRDAGVCTTTRHLVESDAESGRAAAAAATAAITVHEYFAQTTEWNPNLKGFNTDKRKSEALDKYLGNFDTLFYKDARHITQDVALRFLHQCDYDIPLANRLLKPWQPPADPDLDLDEEEMYPADPFCAVCRDGGNLLLCDVCDKSYHAACVQLESVPAGTWTCPYHQCATCFEGVDRNLASLSCSMCPTSFCAQHVPADLRARAEKLACHEVMCSHCLAKEEEYALIHRAKALGALHGRLSATAVAAAWSPGDSCRRAFLHRLQMVLKREGSQLIRLPVLGGRELDLYLLYTQVCKLGGIYAVLDSVGWKEIRRALRLPVRHQSALLKKFYLAILYPYEKQFFPFFTQLPLKKALADNRKEDEEEEEEELALLLAQQTSHKKAQAKVAAAQQLVDRLYKKASSIVAVPPVLKDDTKAEDVLVSLKLVLPTGHASSMSKGKETAAARGKKKIKDKAAKDKQKKKADKEKQKAAAAASATAAASKNQRTKRTKRGDAPAAAAAPSEPIGAAAAMSVAGITAPLKEHPAINIWTPTWWAQQANSSFGSSATAARLAAAAAANQPPAMQLAPTDIQNAAIAAMALTGQAGLEQPASVAGAPAAAKSQTESAAPLEQALVQSPSEPRDGPIPMETEADGADVVAALVASTEAVSVEAPSVIPSEDAAAVAVATTPEAEVEATSSKRKYQEMLLAAHATTATALPTPLSTTPHSNEDQAVSISVAVADSTPAPPLSSSPSLALAPEADSSSAAAPVVEAEPSPKPILSNSPEDASMDGADSQLPADGEEQAAKRRKTSEAAE